MREKSGTKCFENAKFGHTSTLKTADKGSKDKATVIFKETAVTLKRSLALRTGKIGSNLLWGKKPSIESMSTKKLQTPLKDL